LYARAQSLDPTVSDRQDVSVREDANVEPPAAQPPEVELPQLLTPVHVPHPDSDPRPGPLAVELRLTLDVDGRVTEAEVTRSGGDLADFAAREAMLQSRFSPARRHGVAMPARIAWRVELALPRRGRARVRVLDADSPVAGATVTLRQPSETGDESLETREVRTDPEGLARFDRLRTGPLTLVVSRGERTVEQTIELPPDADVELRVAWPAPEGTRAEGAEGADGDAGTDDLGDEELGFGAEAVVSSDSARLRDSAQAVTVVDLRRAGREAADLGEILARTQGVQVRRSGGLGSSTRFCLGGLCDDQVRFLYDGIPLEYTGFSQSPADLPVFLLQRVDVYRGVVPLSLGTDALAGAMNFVSRRDVGSAVAASYQVGSFGTHRAAATGRYRHESGFYASLLGFVDRARNDYFVDVEIPDERGRLEPARVRRFHDAYDSVGAVAELGIEERPWARRLSLTGYFSEQDKELQHNVVMTVPYGEVVSGDRAGGVTLRYEVDPHEDVSLAIVGAYARRTFTFSDQAACVYGWRGECVRERRENGEIESPSRDSIFWEHGTFARAHLAWRLRPGHTLEAVVSPDFATRTGDERSPERDRPGVRDPLTAERWLFKLTSGLSYTANLWRDRVENVLFVKSYFYSTRSEEPIPGGGFRERSRRDPYVGGGNALRVTLVDGLRAKLSYERAIRLPRTDEVFGDAALVLASLDLAPERSHNANLGLVYDDEDTAAGSFLIELNGALRDADQLIVLLGDDRFFRYQNVYRARALGVELGTRWDSPERWVGLEGSLSYLDHRNRSTDGTFASFEGDRIPNRPWLQGSWRLGLRSARLLPAGHELELAYQGRWVHEFFRGWESQGAREFKQVVPTQIAHGLTLGYVHEVAGRTLGATLDVQNLSDAALFDNFGVQRPGRAVYLKITGSLGALGRR
jgi:TonB family protein